MTLGNVLTQMGINTKQLSERYADFAQPSHDQHVYYGYEHTQPSHGHVAYSKHGSYGSGHKNNAAMSALTLLAFLFFLHILQQCLKDHMVAMQTPPIMVMTAGRHGEVDIDNRADINKVDKSGNIEPNEKNQSQTSGNKTHDKHIVYHDETENKYLTKITTADKTEEMKSQKYKHYFKNYVDRSSGFPQYGSDLNDDK